MGWACFVVLELVAMHTVLVSLTAAVSATYIHMGNAFFIFLWLFGPCGVQC